MNGILNLAIEIIRISQFLTHEKYLWMIIVVKLIFIYQMKKVLIVPYPVLPKPYHHTCSVIPSLFSPKQCSQLLNPTIMSNFKKAIDNYPTYYRNNDRQVVDDPNMADSIFQKIKTYIPDKLTIDSNNPIECGDWRPLCLNDRFRFCRYQANQYFHRHLDGVHYRSHNVQSKLTFMVYLNGVSDFQGGRTLFYKDQHSKDIIASYTPKQGDLILFDHNLWHQGQLVTKGQKYVMRSDIVFERISATKKLEQRYSGHLGYIWSMVKWDQDILLSGGRDKIIRVWNRQGQCIQQLKGHDNSILDLIKIDQNSFASCSRDKTIQIWKKKHNQGVEEFTSLRKWVGSDGATVLTLLNLGNGYLASGAADFSIRIFQISTGKEVKQVKAHSDWVWKLLKLDENRIISCSQNGQIKVWNSQSWECEKIIRNINDIPVNSMAISQDATMLYSGDLLGYITCWNLQNGEIKWRKKAHQGLIRCLLVRSNGNIVSGSEDWSLRQWNHQTRQLIYERKHDNFVQDICEKNGKLLSASYDGRIMSH